MDNTVVFSTLKQNNCIGCGICSCVCNIGALNIIYSQDKEYIPVIDGEKCVNCGQCVMYCPNSIIKRTDALNRLSCAEDKIAHGIENAAGYFVCKNRDVDKLLKSASGGFVTEFAVRLLEMNMIDCVIHGRRKIAACGEEHYEATVSENKSAVYENSSSIYGPVCFESALRQFQNESKKILIIGTPCVITGMKKLFEENKSYSLNKIYTIALSCSHTVNGQFTDFMAEKCGVEGKYITDFRAKTKEMNNHGGFYTKFYDNEKTLFIQNRDETMFTPIWRNYFFAQQACTTCSDFWGKDADVSTKDAWGKLGHNERYGSSIVIFRNKELMSIFEQMYNLQIKRVSFEDVRNCQVETVKYKQVDIFNRVSEEGRKIYEKSMQYIYMTKSKQFYREGNCKKVCQELADKVDAQFKVASVSSHRQNTVKNVIKTILHIKPIRLTALFIYSFLRKVKKLFKYKKKKYKKIVMVATFNKINAGDEAQIDATVKIVQDRYPDYLVKVLSHVPHYTYNNHYKCLVDPNPRVAIWDLDENASEYCNLSTKLSRLRFLLKGWWTYLNAYLVRADFSTFFLKAKRASFLQELKTCDLLYFSGGGGMTGATLSRCWDFMFCLKIARVFKVPCVMSGQNSGQWGSKFTERFVANNLRDIRALTLRDTQAINTLSEMGIEGDHIFTMFDDALFCDKLQDVSEYLYEFGIGSDKYIALNIHNWGMEDNKEEQKRIFDRIYRICEYVIDKTKLKILIIPMATVDATPIEDFIGTYPNCNIKVARFDEYDFRILRGLFSKAEYCITMKHHPIIFSIGECVPTISIAYKPYYVYKNKGALDIFGLGRYSLDIDDAGYFNEFQEYFDEIYLRGENMRKEIRSTLEEIKPRREKFFKIIDKLL